MLFSPKFWQHMAIIFLIYWWQVVLYIYSRSTWVWNWVWNKQSRWPGNLPRQQTAAAACVHPTPRDLPGDSRPETAAPSPRSCEANPGQAPRPGHGLMALSLSLSIAERRSAQHVGVEKRSSTSSSCSSSSSVAAYWLQIAFFSHVVCCFGCLPAACLMKCPGKLCYAEIEVAIAFNWWTLIVLVPLLGFCIGCKNCANWF